MAGTSSSCISSDFLKKTFAGQNRTLGDQQCDGPLAGGSFWGSRLPTGGVLTDRHLRCRRPQVGAADVWRDQYRRASAASRASWRPMGHVDVRGRSGDVGVLQRLDDSVVGRLSHTPTLRGRVSGFANMIGNLGRDNYHRTAAIAKDKSYLAVAGQKRRDEPGRRRRRDRGLHINLSLYALY